MSRVAWKWRSRIEVSFQGKGDVEVVQTDRQASKPASRPGRQAGKQGCLVCGGGVGVDDDGCKQIPLQ